MGYQQERDEFMARFGRFAPTGPGNETVGAGIFTARKLLRHASTLQRLAEAQCNGDWPADNGERKTVQCSRCEGGWHPSAMRQDKTAQKITKPGDTKASYVPLICPDCRTQELVTAILKPLNLKPAFNGDPRGAVFVIHQMNTSEADIQSGRERGLYVPARG